MNPATTKFLRTFCALFFLINLFIVHQSYGQVPPPPPPGGSELWAGSSSYLVPGDPDPDCQYCAEYWTFIITICIRWEPCPADDTLITENWDSNDLNLALNGIISLPGGYSGYAAIIAGINSGALSFDNADWDELVDWSLNNGGGDANEACQLARADGYEPPNCAGVPIPKWLDFALMFSMFVVVYFNKGHQNYVKFVSNIFK